MKKSSILFRACVVTGVFLVARPANAIEPKLGDIQDSRTTGQFFAGLKIDMDLVGDDVADAKRLRVQPLSAVDDTGRDLIDPEKLNNIDYEEVEKGSGSSHRVSLEFKNPARKATTIKELKGRIELFVPKNDPSAIAIFDNLKNAYGRPLDSEVLKQNGIEFIAVDKAAYSADQKKQTDQAAAKAKAEGASDEQIKMMTELAADFDSVDENSLVLRVKDPNHKLIGFELRRANGEKIHLSSTMTTQDHKTVSFDDPVPADGRLVLYVGTAKAVVAKDFSFNDVALP
jgi:hypothetical protein